MNNKYVSSHHGHRTSLPLRVESLFPLTLTPPFTTLAFVSPFFTLIPSDRYSNSFLFRFFFSLCLLHYPILGK